MSRFDGTVLKWYVVKNDSLSCLDGAYIHVHLATGSRVYRTLATPNGPIRYYILITHTCINYLPYILKRN